MTVFHRLPGQQRFALIRRRSDGRGAAVWLRRSSPTFWIGMSMFCLVIVYVVIVITVTSRHMTSTTSPSAPLRASTLQRPPLQMDKKKTLKQALQEAKQEKKKELPKQEPPPPKLGRKIDPQVLIPHEGEAPLAIKDDPKDHPTPDTVLKAFVEKIDFDELQREPLPSQRSTAAATKLKEIAYPRLNSCSRLTQQWPVDDTPTDEDSFLPWIHDVFPTEDGRYIQFVAQNKRRCKTGRKDTEIMAFMAPQAALFQHVPLRRTKDGYEIVDYPQADPDSQTTRFICRFKPSGDETLSIHNVDYDWTAYRKHYKVTFQENDGGIKSIHTTQLLFRCPVPEHLVETVRTGASVKDDWASLFVDLVPLRTMPRWGIPNQYLAPWYNEFVPDDDEQQWDAQKVFGDGVAVPKIEDSGRWENIPICKPSLMTFEGQDVKDLPAKGEPTPKKHKLVSCIWASAGYTTRGERFAINDGQRRLLEWITHNKNIGFDHFYVYDNTGAFRDDTSLKPIADLMPDDVTYIPWPSKICNNNPNNVDSPGERSSQYAAEMSCKLRFGPHVEWIGQFDIDEYLIPMGEHKTALTLLDKLDKEDTRIVSFGSWRAWPRWAFIDTIEPIDDPKVCWHKEPCFELRVPMNYTMLQAYNCDRQKPGQKNKQMPAEKQIYRADYVLQHFVHYSATTALSMKNRTEYEKEGFKWWGRPFPDKRQRFADEVTEALMIHTKAVAIQDTSGWQRVCHINNTYAPKDQQGLCRLGVPWPKDPELAKRNATKDGWAFNCYVNEQVENYHVPRLDAELKKLHFFAEQQ